MGHRVAAVAFAAIGLITGGVGLVLLLAALQQPDGSAADEGRWLVMAFLALVGSAVSLAAARRSWMVRQ